MMLKTFLVLICPWNILIGLAFAHASCPFFKWVFVFMLSFEFFWILLLCLGMVCKYFLLVCSLFFTVSFTEQNTEQKTKSILLPFIDRALGNISKNSLPRHRSQKCSPYVFF